MISSATYPTDEQVKRFHTKAIAAIAMVLTIGLAALGQLFRQLPKRRSPTSFSSWVTTSA